MTSTFSTRSLVYVSLFAALIAAFALVPPIPVPVVPVPITLQTLGVMLAGLVLGPRLGALAVLLYVGLAVLGLPILPGGRGGLAVLAGPTGGFLLGFVLGAWIIGLVARRANTDSDVLLLARYFMACVFGGILAVYAVGIPWLSGVAGMSLAQAAMAVLVFVPGDMIKAALAAFVAWRLSRLQLMSR
ncbi:biotin transporter BioY [Orrella marina]|uniref:Biotin transporter n=1 Tax=Orrella marina TaxID=2163011 RepID=A0A2R4XJU2_9BURK|nr:biotin transporter BioY [Orrella marina]AWB34056.1 BioY family transporter [Orrella marina]